jgi:TolB-like protein/DNA-binding winged helix-turn-helix (wHTH) protein/Flp pilus assembly protein TadD
MDLLILLVERRGQLVTRAEIIDRLWGKDVFVEVETGVHTAIRKIRQALRDSADSPAFVETVAGKGYRFTAPVEVVGEPPAPAPETVPDATSASVATPGPAPPPNRRAVRLGWVAAGVLLAAGGWAWFAPRAANAPVMLAVLPFDNLSGDPDQQYLADGIAEDTIASLGQIDPDHLLVVGRTSVLAYRGTTKSLLQIGRELNAGYLVEGSVRAESGRVRITAKLVRVADQAQVWAQSFDREPASLLGLQRELSGAIAEQIRLRLSPERAAAIERRQTQRPDAYDLYLRGRYYANRATPAGMLRALDYYQQAVALDPEYALAWSGIAEAYGARPINSDVPPRDVRDQARQAAAHAVAAAPDLAEAQTAVGYVEWMLEWDWPAAEAALRRAIALDRGYAPAWRNLGHLLSQMGHHADARDAIRRARELDPMYAMNHALSSQVAYQARDYDAALEHARQSTVIDPEFWIGHIMLGAAYEQLGKADLAAAALAEAARLSGGNSKTLALRGHLLATRGGPDAAREVLKTLASISRDRYVPPYTLALVHAGLGDREAAFEWLERGYAARDVHLMFLTAEAKWDRYRGDPRFERLLDRCGFRRAAAPPAPAR